MFTLERQAQHVADAQRCVAPCRGNMSKMGQRPSTHTGAYRLNVLGAISVERIGRNTPIYIVSPTHTNPRFTPVCVEGRCPYFDILPLQGAIPFKPCTWGNPGCRSLRSLYPGLRYHCPYRAPRFQNLRGALSLVRPALPWAEIPLPLQGAAASKPPKDKQGVAASKPLNPASKPPKDKWSFSR